MSDSGGEIVLEVLPCVTPLDTQLVLQTQRNLGTHLDSQFLDPEGWGVGVQMWLRAGVPVPVGGKYGRCPHS